ncbi:pyrroline-5-carboxylate reductase family protein [Bifidobacterium vansinderenii]|uniref:Pyrroline-5-carboxylate reductase n=1 Tax=Bifidobacterium vansinderenii TaxID=1984871 RepID=A0A229VZB6_9BIFI|nr:pyrroline-5-carboxylate reductase dimerization domain-containing protein [Bifidobacterium vansinderenii]OXN00945.1 pyrroline-5-carboxylate reductase [Bifidobacterium vansinderenii]
MAANLYFIGGGNMPTAIIEAVRRKADAYPVDHIYVEEISQERSDYLAATYNTEAATPNSRVDADIVVIAVRPQDDVAGVAKSIADRFDPAKTTVISIVAGYTIAKLEAVLGEQWRVVRIIPNTLTTVDYGYSGASLNAKASKDDVDAFLNTFGKVLYVEERLIDIITGFYPPNIVYHFIDAYVDAGVLAGLPRDIAKAIALDTLIGGTEFLKQKDVLPQVLLNINNSPGGVGITQAYTLNKTGFAAAIQSAVLAAVERTTALGSNSK